MTAVVVVHRRDGSTFTRRAALTAADRDEHGTLARFQCGCRCARCRRARREYDRLHYARRQLTRTGKVNRRVSPAAAALHIARLRAAGWSVRRIAAASGWSPRTVMRVVQCHREGNGRVWSLVERDILALVP